MRFRWPFCFQRKFKAQCHDGLKPDLSLETRQPSEQNMTKFTSLLVAFPFTGAAQKATKHEQGTVCILLTCFHQTGTCISLSLLSQSNTYTTHRFSLGRKLKTQNLPEWKESLQMLWNTSARVKIFSSILLHVIALLSNWIWTLVLSLMLWSVEKNLC